MPTINKIFVYGTLLREFNSSMVTFLNHTSEFYGEGYLPGQLYDLGQYPGLVWQAGALQKVYGQIRMLQAYELAMEIMDEYEGFLPGYPEKGEYKREVVPVEMGDQTINCWTYLYNRSTDGLHRISSGNYLEYARENPDHQRFLASV